MYTLHTQGGNNMRRLWAHILIAFASIFIMGTTFTSIFKNVSSNQDFNDGREIVFRLTDKEDAEREVEVGANKVIAGKMAERLDNSGITAYKIDVAGDDIIKVTFSQNNDVSRNNLVSYLSFNGSLGLSNMDDNDNYIQLTGDEFLLEGSKAYLDNVNNYPTVVIPVDTNNDNFKLLLENTRTQKENGVGETKDTGEKDEDGNAVTETTTYLYLWYDFNEETDRYSRTVQDSEDYDANIAQKILMKFNIDDLWYPDGKENKLAALINLDSNSDQSLDYTEVRNGYDNARFFVNLLNADALDYDVKYINNTYDVVVPSWIESVVKNGDPNRNVAWSKTMIATIIAIVIVSLLLVVFFKLSATSIIVSSLLSAYGGLGFLVLLGGEFNISILVGILLVTLASLASGIIYACKLKDESYKGRSLRKANTEAARKSLLPTLDINLVVVLVGVFCYLFGGSLLRSFALVTVLGGIVSLLANLLLTRGLMWLATNTTALNNRYSLFGINEEKVPSLEKEEKQTYFSPYQDRDLTKNKKVIGIIGCLFCVAGLAGLIVNANLNNGQYYKDNLGTNTTEIYFYTTDEDSVITTNNYVKEKILDRTYLSYTDQEPVSLGSKVDDVVTYAFTESKNGVSVTTNYIVASFKSALTGEENAYYLNQDDTKSEVTTLTDILTSTTDSEDNSARVSVKPYSTYDRSKPHTSGIMLGTVVASLVIGVYLLLRYRLSRGLSSIILALANVTAISGLFALLSLTGIAFGTNLILVMPFLAGFTYILEIIWMNRERELIIEDKVNNKSLSRNDEMMVKATSSAIVPAGILTIIAAYLLVDFFGFGASAYSTLFAVSLLGVATGFVITIILLGPISQFFYKRLSGVNVSLKPKKKKKKSGNIKPNRSSGEPEEAIFIGIND
ncbi:MAG: hypothetical protein E7181_03710 [Erysipelotrichaceae bacterium]|nr:hypothetical protein [Erysipelotrichaceae bacterium]